MCGRFTLKTPAEEFERIFGPVVMEYTPEPRYNIAPTQTVAAIIHDDRPTLAGLRWGLIPSWSKDPAIGSRMINARAETLREKPSFRDGFRKRRCLIPADGFYEWAPVPGSTRKQPIYFRLRSGQPFVFAGLWDTWSDPSGRPIRSCAIITTTPNALVEPVHNRMPVLFAPEQCAVWLGQPDAPLDALQALLAPYPAADMVSHPVGDRVNKAGYEGPDCILPAG